MLAGCDAVVQAAMTDISKGLRMVAFKDAAWCTEDFRAVLRSIVSSPHAAVPVEQLDALLGAGGDALGASLDSIISERCGRAKKNDARTPEAYDTRS